MISEDLIERVLEKPYDYAICLNAESCPKRERCLHALETTASKCSAQIIRCVNPQLYADGKECAQFRDKDAKCRYAFGFTRQSERMKAMGKYKEFMTACQKWFCRTVYYDMRAGNRTITPDEQRIIIGCAEKVGVHFPANAFDRMVETTDWH